MNWIFVGFLIEKSISEKKQQKKFTKTKESWTLINFNGLSTYIQVLTKDSVTVSVDAVVYYRVNNATISIANVENAHHSTRLLAQTTLRNTMGTRHLHEILSERMTISGSMQVSGPLRINYGDTSPWNLSFCLCQMVRNLATKWLHLDCLLHAHDRWVECDT